MLYTLIILMRFTLTQNQERMTRATDAILICQRSTKKSVIPYQETAVAMVESFGSHSHTKAQSTFQAQ